MARTSSPARRAPARVPPARPPSVIAIERLAKMAVQGVAAHKMVAAARDIMQAWRAGGVEPGSLREQLEALSTDLDLGAQAAEDYVGEAETDGQRKSAQAQFEALVATRAAVLAEMELP